MRKVTLTGSLVLALAAAVPSQAAAEQLPLDVQAQLPLASGLVYELCPVTDIPPAQYRRRARQAWQQFEALVREVGVRPQAQFVRVSSDSHTGEEIREPMTVLSLAEEHLDEQGIEKAPCARTLLTRLRDAVLRAKGQTPPAEPAPVDEPVFLLDQTVAALSLRHRDGAYRNSRCRRGIVRILTERDEVELERKEPLGRNVRLVTVPQRTVGVLAYKPTDRCREFLQRRLKKLAARPFRI